MSTWTNGVSATPPSFPLGPGSGSVRIAFALHKHAAHSDDHIDLFIGGLSAGEQFDPDARVARTFRLPLTAWGNSEPLPGSYPAVERETHRAEYLALTTVRELSAGRGVVTPVARAEGIAHVSQREVELAWSGWRMLLERRGDDAWCVQIARIEGANGAGKDGY